MVCNHTYRLSNPVSIKISQVLATNLITKYKTKQLSMVPAVCHHKSAVLSSQRSLIAFAVIYKVLLSRM
jgi:hypothetical protein